MNIETKAVMAIQKIQRECPTCIFDSNAAVEMKEILIREFNPLQERIEELESLLNALYHSTSCTTYQMELINEVCLQK